jgi:hypothetical protein
MEQILKNLDIIYNKNYVIFIWPKREKGKFELQPDGKKMRQFDYKELKDYAKNKAAEIIGAKKNEILYRRF